MQGKLLTVALCFVLGAASLPVLAGSAMETDYVLVARFQETLNQAYSGKAEAQYELARMYEKGSGTSKDLGQALEWYNKSAAQGYSKSQAQLGYMYLHGDGAQKNPGKGIKLLTLAAESNNVRAQYHLAEAYETGSGVRKNTGKAMSWYQRAAAGGYRPAQKAAAKLQDRLDADAKRRQAAESKRKQELARIEKEKNSRKAAKSQKHAATIELTQLLYSGTWLSDDDDALVLPSGGNDCKQLKELEFECLSREVERHIGSSTVVYVTKALIHDMNREGRFTITYQNNVLSVKRHKSNNILFGEEDDEISKGWQQEYDMDCRLSQERNQVDCLQEGTTGSTFTRQGAEESG